MSTLNCAVDIGSGFTQYMTKAGGKPVEGHFPSLVCKINVEDIDFGGDKGKVFTLDGQTYIVGDQAQAYGNPTEFVDTLKSNWSGSTEWKVLLCAALIECGVKPTDGSGSTVKINLVTGIPQEIFVRHKAIVESVLRGTLEFKLGDNLYQANIEPMLMPQAAGALVYAMQLNPDLDETEAIGVIDVGTYTTGLSVMDNNAFVSYRSGGCEVGISQLLDGLDKELRNKFNHRSVPEKLPTILQSKQFRHRGKIVEIKEVVDRLQTQMVQAMLNKIQERWQTADDLLVFVAGGGAPYFLESIQTVVPHAVLMENHFVAVVRGMHKYQEVKLENQEV